MPCTEPGIKCIRINLTVHHASKGLNKYLKIRYDTINEMLSMFRSWQLVVMLN